MSTGTPVTEEDVEGHIVFNPLETVNSAIIPLQSSAQRYGLHCWLSLCTALSVMSAATAQTTLPEEAEVTRAAERPEPDSLQRFIREQYVPQWHNMFTNIPGDWARYSRASFQTSNIPAIVGMTALTAALIVTDDETWQLSDRLYKSSSFARSTSDFFEYLGDGRPQFGLSAAFALYGFAADDPRALRTASQTVEAILACGIVVQVFKHVTGRESPLVSSKPGGVWDFFPNQIEYHRHVPKYDAFPSGHIATALATVTVVAENYPEWTWVRPVGYTIVALIGISMANTGIHWYSDYPLGLAMGYSFGMLAAHPERLTAESVGKDNSIKVTFAPVLNVQGAGLSVTLLF